MSELTIGEFLNRMKRAAVAIHASCPEPVAEDVAAMLNTACSIIERLQRELDEARASIPDNHPAADWWFDLRQRMGGRVYLLAIMDEIEAARAPRKEATDE